MQATMNPYLANMRVRCMPANPNAPDAGWDTNSPSIAQPAPAHEPSADNPSCPGSMC
jgi:hypothetical protein